MTSSRVVLADLLRDHGAFTARLPALMTPGDVDAIRLFAAGLRAACKVVLSFRFQDLDDMGGVRVHVADRIAGIYDTFGAPLVALPTQVQLQVSLACAGAGGLSLGRPGRNMLHATVQGSLGLQLPALAPVCQGAVVPVV